MESNISERLSWQPVANLKFHFSSFVMNHQRAGHGQGWYYSQSLEALESVEYARRKGSELVLVEEPTVVHEGVQKSKTNRVRKGGSYRCPHTTSFKLQTPKFLV